MHSCSINMRTRLISDKDVRTDEANSSRGRSVLA